MGRQKPIRDALVRHVLPPFVLPAFRALGSTWRYVEVKKHAFEQARGTGKPLILSFLHARWFPLLAYSRRLGHGKWMVLCSRSLEGDLAARLEEGLGYRVVRGSSGRGGSRALVHLIQTVRNDPGWWSCLATDGSRGPRGIVQPGLITLARKTGGLLLPMAASARPSWVYRWSWDRTVLPLPFATVHVVWGNAIEVPAEPDEAHAEELRSSLEQALLDLHGEADELSGFMDAAPLRAAI